MTFRAAMAAGLLAAVSLACTEAPKSRTTTTTKARAVTPPKKLGQYTMTVTPIDEQGGRRARVEVVPDLQDGNPNTNPGGSVQVAGRFSATIEPAGGTGCAGQSLFLPLTVTNFSAEPLASIQVQITEMSKTGFEVCRPTGVEVGAGVPGLLPVPANTSPGAALGLVNYGTLAGATLAGAPINTGVAPGGTSTLGWWFKFPSNTPVTFTFVVWADPQQPELIPVGPDYEVGLPLTWTSMGSGTAQLELCTVDPAETGFACPAGSRAVTPVTGVGGVAPWSFSASTATLTAGTTYWWRATNTFGVAGVTGNYASTWESFTAVAPFFAPPPTLIPPAGPFPADSTVTAAPILLDWTTDLAVSWSHILICDTADCLPAGAAVGFLDESFEAGTLDVLAYTYSFDALLSLPTDPATGDTWLLPGTYYYLVYNFDDLAGADLGAPAAGSFVVSPVGAALPEIVSPVVGDTFPADSFATGEPVLLQWISDPAVSTTSYAVCDTVDCLPNVGLGLVGFLGGATVPGTVVAPGVPTEYAVDVAGLITLDPAAEFNWLLPGTYYFTVVNVIGGVPEVTGVSGTIVITSSMPALPVVVGPTAPNDAFVQNALPSAFNPVGYPINVEFVTLASVSEAVLELCDTPDCATPIPADGRLGAIYSGFFPATTLGASLNTYVVDVTTLLMTDFAGASGGAYLQPGIVYWRVYNVDGTTAAILSPPSTMANFNVVATPSNFVASAANVTTASAASYPTPYLLGFDGNALFAAATVEVCDAVDCANGVAGMGLAMNPAPGTGTFAFEIDMFTVLPIDGVTGLPTEGTWYWRVIDDDVYTYLGFTPPVTSFTAMGSFTITP